MGTRPNGTSREGRASYRRATALLLLLGAGAPCGVAAQSVSGTLTLGDALRLARGNNPGFLSTRNDVGAADWRVREAYGAFLPQVSASGSASYTEAGVQRIGTLDFGAQSTDWYSSRYSVNVSWTLDGATLFGVPNAKANRAAAEAGVASAAYNLESVVTLQYMAALRARDGVAVARRQLERARQNLRLVETRVASGAAAGTEGKQAEVDVGRAEVGLIQARRQYREAVALLAEQIGVVLDEAGVDLSSSFEVFEPTWDREELLAWSLESHPSLDAVQARAGAARAAARQAASAYFPSVTLSTGLSGNTLQALNEDFIRNSVISQQEARREQCEFMNAVNAGLTQPLPGYQPQNCTAFVASDDLIRSALRRNASFPFDFTKTPVTVSLSVSVPVFTGFSRQRQVAEARQAAEDARHDLRAEELRLRTAVTQAFDNLTAAYRVVELEERNRRVAEEQLQLQQRRYALGAAALLELLDAQTTVSTADQAYLNALYDFHWNLIRLEAAVGRRLRSR